MTIKEHLREQGITIYQLAKEINMPRTTLEDIVNGKTELKECKYSTLHKISLFLEISVEDLVEEQFIVNIPVATRKKSKKNKLGFMGVCFRTDRSEFNAYIKVLGRSVDLGSYKTLEEALAARRAGEKVKEIFHTMMNH